jgi:acyl carrier protein
MDDKRDIDGRVKLVIAENLGEKIENIIPEARLEDDLDADSLDFIDLIMAIEEEFGIEIPDEEASKLTTVKDIILYVAAKVEGA